ncbi:hypothetical protein GGX14DRAFT_673289 [Mycena pura]|uniref:DUF6533 domain-containing protein n=1 Tax=Mycena pura TaxID=153505 RepID=A0AAD6Y8K9_9AGAR|nr:hypothetical protein GGX14DRAFT_673289 [Mycena pura]
MSHYSMDLDEPPLLDPATFTRELRLYRSLVLASSTYVWQVAVLLTYDYTLTLATEVKFIWAAKLRPSICWFLGLRYIGLVANIANSVIYFADLSPEVRVPLFSWVRVLNDLFSAVCIRIDIYSFVVLKFLHSSCVKMQLVWKGFLVIQEVLVECTLIMRVFAMYDRNWRILILLLVVFSPWPALAVWDTIKLGQPQIFSVPGISGCALIIPRTSIFRLAGGWEAQIACDILVFLLTIRRAYVQRETFPRYAGTLLWRMTTDGAGIIIFANAANLVTFYLGDNLLAGFLSWFVTSLSVVLLSRLMLNLHEAAAVGTTMEEPSTIELDSATLRFAAAQTMVDDGA